MTHEDDLINGAFEEFTTTSTPIIKVAEAGAIRAEGKHRRRVRNTMLSVLAALVIVTPVAAFAALDRGNQGPPPPPGSSPTAEVSPAPSVSPSPAKSAEPSSPDGRFTRAQLVGLTIDAPKVADWDNCGGGRIKLLDKADSAGEWQVTKAVVHADLDGDVALETAVHLTCNSGDPSQMFVLALDRTADGKPVVLAAIIASQRSSSEPQMIRNLAANPAGGILVTVCPQCGSDPDESAWKNRWYYWDGRKFAHEVHAQPWVADLAISVKDVKNLGVKDGRISVKVTVTVQNKGAVTSGRFAVEMISNAGRLNEKLEAKPAGWLSDGKDDKAPTVWAQPLRAGESTTVTVTITKDYSQQYEFENWFNLRIVQVDQAGGQLNDPNRDNDSRMVEKYL